MILVTKWFGTFLCEENKIIDKRLFPKDAGAIAEKLAHMQRGGTLPEEQELVDTILECVLKFARLRIIRITLQQIGARAEDDGLPIRGGRVGNDAPTRQEERPRGQRRQQYDAEPRHGLVDQVVITILSGPVNDISGELDRIGVDGDVVGVMDTRHPSRNSCVCIDVVVLDIKLTKIDFLIRESDGLFVYTATGCNRIRKRNLRAGRCPQNLGHYNQIRDKAGRIRCSYSISRRQRNSGIIQVRRHGWCSIHCCGRSPA